MRRIDRIDAAGNAREHVLRENTTGPFPKTLCGLEVWAMRKPSTSPTCGRCAARALALAEARTTIASAGLSLEVMGESATAPEEPA